jgi:hypothetical protein
MVNKIDTLLSSFEKVISEPWSGTLSTSERIMFLVYDPAEQRKIDFRIDEFETVTKKAGKKCIVISMKTCFPTWISNHEYRDEYFKDPEALIDQLETNFKHFAIEFLNGAIAESKADESTLVAVKDVSSLFGFARLSDVLNGLSNEFKGRLLIFFPGEFDKNHFRLMDARDGWSYLARPITV